MQTTIFIGIGLYLALMIFLGLRASQKENAEGFVIGNRNVGYIPTIGSIATSFRDGMGAVFWIGIGFTTGYAGLWMIGGVMLGAMIYFIFAPSIRRYAKENDIITINQMIKTFIGLYSEKITSIIILVFAVLMIALQLFVAGNIFAEVGHLEPWIGIFTAAFVVGLYLFFGGYSTVVLTDHVQFILILALVALPFFIPPSKEAIMNVGSLFEFSQRDQIAFFVFGFLYILSGSEAWQRIFSAKNDNVARFSFPLASIALLFMTLSLIWVGMSAQGTMTPDVEQGRVLFELFNQSVFPSWVLSFIAIVVLAITMSTLDTFCYLFAATFSKNILPKKLTQERFQYVRLSKMLMIGVLIVGSLLALTASDVVQFLFNASALMFILTPVYLSIGFGWFKQSELLDKLISLSVIISVAVYLYMFLNGYFEDMILMYIPVLLNSLLCILSVIINHLFYTKHLEVSS